MSEFTETTTTGWFSRISGSIKGIGFGFVMIIGAIVLLWWNEGRAVKTYRGLKEGESVTISIKPDKINPKNENKLVHLTGLLNTNDTLFDQVFNIKSTGVKMKRNVEMFQWKEKAKTKTKKNVGGSETKTTTYSYKQDWYSYLINSGDFNDQSKQNPKSMPIKSRTLESNKVSIGAFELSSELINNINDYNKMDLSGAKVDSLYFPNHTVMTDYIFIGRGSISNPQIGDIKVTYEEVQLAEYSILSEQVGSSFKPYLTSEETYISVIKKGNLTIKEMFKMEHSANDILTYALRLVGLLLIFFGIKLLFKIFEVIGDIIPFVGTIIGYGMNVVSGVLAFVISFIVVGIAWFAYRPIMSLIFISVSAITFAAVYFLIYKRK